jgi:hypothetical protein
MGKLEGLPAWSRSRVTALCGSDRPVSTQSRRRHLKIGRPEAAIRPAAWRWPVRRIAPTFAG